MKARKRKTFMEHAIQLLVSKRFVLLSGVRGFGKSEAMRQATAIEERQRAARKAARR